MDQWEQLKRRTSAIKHSLETNYPHTPYFERHHWVRYDDTSKYCVVCGTRRRAQCRSTELSYCN